MLGPQYSYAVNIEKPFWLHNTVSRAELVALSPEDSLDRCVVVFARWRHTLLTWNAFALACYAPAPELQCSDLDPAHPLF